MNNWAIISSSSKAVMQIRGAEYRPLSSAPWVLECGHRAATLCCRVPASPQAHHFLLLPSRSCAACLSHLRHCLPLTDITLVLQTSLSTEPDKHANAFKLLCEHYKLPILSQCIVSKYHMPFLSEAPC